MSRSQEFQELATLQNETVDSTSDLFEIQTCWYSLLRYIPAHPKQMRVPEIPFLRQWESISVQIHISQSESVRVAGWKVWISSFSLML
jgi:hypothetical protein|tara:strand:- start:504 stop:767 length:264 start_codon:yes stop_codon:yes gene_type:complete